ncbi:hypothetical protein [Candidatus Tisiphia endosymbiont of Micropterix aruncella]|uniref:hypothetical protein n=1 Tax=Candidatus Tisiphia endosymbiont of Micropterix aruncella TaxID=3066271 RepID=UPI003AA9A867
MGRINNGDWANQHRKTQGQFLSKQDREAHLFSKKLNNGSKQQDETLFSKKLNNGGNKQDDTLDLYNNILETGSILNGETNPLKQKEGVRFIDGSKPHTLSAQGLLAVLSFLPMIHPETTAPPRKGLPPGNQNDLSSTVKNSTESKPPVFFDTISATTSTSQNHDKSKGSTKHSKIKLAKEQKVFDQYKQPQLRDDYTLELESNLNSKFKNILAYKHDINGFYQVLIWGSVIGRKEAEEIGKNLRNVKALNLGYNNITAEGAEALGRVILGTDVTQLYITNSNMGDEGSLALAKGLGDKKTNLTELSLKDNHITDEGARKLILWLRKHPEIINLSLGDNDDEYIKFETVKEISKVLAHHRGEDTYSDAINDQIKIIDIDSNTYKLKSSTTEEEFSKDIPHTGKQEKRDIHTTNEPTSSPTEDTTVTEKDLTTSATTPTSQNHDKSKDTTKHSEIKLAKEQKVSDEHEQSQLNDDPSMVKRSAGTGYSIIINDNELIFGHVSLNTKTLKQKLEENSNITKLHLWNVWGVGSKAQEIGKNLKGTNVEELSLAYNSITDEGAIDLIKSLKEGDTKVKVLNLAHNNISNKGAEDLIPELTDTQIIEVDLTGNKDIEPETLQKISKVLEHNRDEDTYSDEINDQIEDIDIDSNTYNLKSSTTEKESSKDISHGKREKRDIHTTNEPTSSPTEDPTVTEEDLTTSIPEGSSTSTVKSTTFEDKPSTSTTAESTTEESLMTMDADVVADSTLTISYTTTDSVTVGSTPQETTILKEEPTPTTVKSTVPTTDGSSTTMTESIAFSTEDSTTTKEIITPTIVKSTVSTTDGSSTTTTKSIASSTEDPTTTKEIITSTIVKSTVPTTDGSSSTTTESIAFSTEDPTTTKEIITSTIVKSTVPTTKESSTTTTESIASSTEDPTTTGQEIITPTTVKSTVPTTDGSSTTITESIAFSTEDSTTTKEGASTPITVQSTVSTTDGSSTTMTESIAFSTEDPTTTKEIITSTIVKSTVPTTKEFSTTTTESIASSTEYPTTTGQEIITPTTVKSTVPTTDGSSTTMTESIASSTEDPTTPEETTIFKKELTTSTTIGSIASFAGNPTTDSVTVGSTSQETTILKEEPTPTTVKSNASITDGSSTTTIESIASSTEDSTTPEETIFKEEATTKESNPNDPASSTMSIAEISGIAVGATIGGAAIIGIAIVGARAVIKKFCSGVSHLGNEAFALVGVNLDSHLDNHEDTPFTGNVNNMDVSH